MSTFPPPDPADVARIHAGFALRLRAFVVDGLVQLLFLVPFLVLLVVSVATGEERACSRGQCRVPAEGVLIVSFLAFFVGLFFGARLLATRLGSTGQTPGCRFAGIRVVDQHTGLPIGTGRALGRLLLAGTISGWFCYLGYLWMLWDGRRQTWHDKIVGSIVVRT